MKRVFNGMTFSLCFLAAGCSTAVQYQPPVPAARYENAVRVNESKDSIWKRMLSALSKEFFVINNLDKESGLINVSYSGDPGGFIDCGWMTVSDPSGGETSFPAAKKFQQYRAIQGLYAVDIRRGMDLEGRANILVEEIEREKTRVSANVRYIVTRTVVVQEVGGPRSSSNTDRTTFNTGGSGEMPGRQNTVVCRPTGAMERHLLAPVAAANLVVGE